MTPSMKSMREEAERIIGEAIGQASMCWDPPPGHQIFDSTQASKIVDETMKKLKIAMVCGKCGLSEGRDFRGRLCDKCAFPNGVKLKVAKKLDAKARKSLSAGAFVFPEDRRYPIHDENHARNALARASGKPEEAKVRAAVHAQYPGISKAAAVGAWAARQGQKAVKYLRSIPRAVPRNVGNTMKGFATPIKSMKAGWHADNHIGRAMTVGFAGMDAMDAMKKEDPSGRGRGRSERVGAAIGNTAGGLIGLPHGTMSGGIVGSALGSYVGGRAGRMVDGAVKVVRRPPAPKPMAPVEAR